MSDPDDDSNNRRRPSTIIDVANEAGVAIGTVSRYLNGLPVRHGNRDLIEAAIQRLGYRRNAVAAAMKSDLTNTVGFMVPALSEFHAAMLEQLSRRMRTAGRALLTYCHNDDPASIVEALDFFAAHRVDCLVMDGNEEASEGVRELVSSGTPVIFYDNDVPGLPVDRVLVENRAGERSGGRPPPRHRPHAHRRARRRPAQLHRPRAARGLRSGHARARRRDPARIRRRSRLDREPGLCGDAAAAVARRSAHRHLRLQLQHGGRRAGLLKEHGYRVPDDISVASFDDVPLFRLHEAGITAVAQPIEKIAETITSLMVSRLSEEGAWHAPHTIMLGCDIILRGSTRRPAAAALRQDGDEIAELHRSPARELATSAV